MGHNITRRASGEYEMAYVGPKPWHSLGQEVPKGCSVDDMRKAARLDWEAIPAVVQYHNQDGLLLPVEGKRVLYRSDTSAPLGVVSDKYEIVQPAMVLETFREMTEGAGWYIHTAGSLRGGAKVWAMATNEVLAASIGGKYDHVKANMLVATSLDGSMKTRAKLCGERVVCENTWNIALAEQGQEIVLSHRGEFDPDVIQGSLDIAVHSFARMVEEANAMCDRAVGTDEALHVLRDLFGQPTDKEIKPTTPNFEFERLMAQFGSGPKREQRSVVRAMTLYMGEGMGANLASSKGTAWGLLNAVTQHIDHERGRTDDTRMESAWFGEGERVKGLAYNVLAQMAGVA